MDADSTTAPNGATALTIRALWDANFAAWQAAKSDYDTAAATHDADYEAAEAEGRKGDSELAKACDDAGALESAARFALVLTPAPDFPTVRIKFDLLFGDDMFGAADDYATAWNRQYTDAIRADMARLQSEAAAAWLARWTENGGSVLIDDEGKAQFSWPADSNVPMRESGMGEQADRQDSCWRDGNYHGIMRGLFQSLGAGLSDIIKAQMRADGTRVIYRPREQGK
jgi:hypothetical protein